VSSESLLQRTLKTTARCTGVGLHGGQSATVRLVPAPVDHGIVFVRVDLPQKPSISLKPAHVSNTTLSTTLSCRGAAVSTVEHLLAAVSGLGIDNVRVEIDGPEVPIMDGSAAPFVAAIQEAGVRIQDEARQFLVIRKAVSVREGDKFASFTPSKHFRIHCTIDFRHPLISDQQCAIDFSQRNFLKEIASARTFGFLRDVERMREMGLAKGGSLDNAVVVDEFSILNPEGLRFPDEFVRHKLLDAIGDIALLGHPVIGTLTAHKTGHALNQRLVAHVLSDASNYELVRARVTPPVSEESTQRVSGLYPSVA
jgi:UDP-3-O-[3-hydroxymyristoyl] N-acetylglucosamine deacetylase